jgi:DNA-binding MarR family transcriptional regulator
MEPHAPSCRGVNEQRLASDFTDLFSQVYLRFHRRRGKRDVRMTAQQWSVLQHLAMAGPLTIGECTQHLGRAQSVVSEIVDGLESKGLLERMRDTRDKRRVLVWLTDEAHAVIARERQVLDLERLARVAAKLSPSEQKSLMDGMRALVRAAETSGAKEKRS